VAERAKECCVSREGNMMERDMKRNDQRDEACWAVAFSRRKRVVRSGSSKVACNLGGSGWISSLNWWFGACVQ
jgi:hypothetical protein